MIQFQFDDLILCDFLEEDIDSDYLSWLNNVEHMRFSDQRHTEHTLDTSLKFLNSFKGTENMFLTIKGVNLKNRGTLTIYYDHFNHQANIGVLIAPKEVGGGLGTCVMTNLSKLLPNRFRLKKVTSGTCELNTAMQKVLRKAGFNEDYRDRSSFLYEDGYYDKIIFAKYY